MTDFQRSIEELQRAQAAKTYSAGTGPLGTVSAAKFMDSRGLQLDAPPIFYEDGHGAVYIRSRDSWTACFLWNLQSAVLCVNAVDHFTMPTKFQGIFDHRYDMPIGIAIGDSFHNIAGKVFSQQQDGFSSVKAALKLREVMAPPLCEKLRATAIMRNKTRLVIFSHNAGPKRSAKLYKNLGFAPAEVIGDTTLWVRPVHDESNQQ